MSLYLSTSEAAKIIGIKTPIFRRWCRNKYLKTIRLPNEDSPKGRHYIRQQDLVDFATKLGLPDDIVQAIQAYRYDF